ncbi:hypothetical protein GCM10020366_57290 [Saccharopolyspora gregorii]|uniref:Uncharacterized protein n=1 Tax=Saccharopolyspora gregorii TaxID=33914 RepID=A0ABP6RZ45_9PSEU
MSAPNGPAKSEKRIDQEVTMGFPIPVPGKRPHFPRPEQPAPGRPQQPRK